jgi:ribosome-binding protein aMBF1 (putative translation factor)
MFNQDWKPVVFNEKKEKNINNIEHKPKPNNINEDFKIEAPKLLGQTILQARNACNKNQKQLANELGIAVQILSRWEVNKEIPNNLQIANIEKILKVKLPRVKKVKIENN